MSSQADRTMVAARGTHASSEGAVTPAGESGHGGALMLSRRFAPLFWCQFFSAYTENFLKGVLGLLILFHLGANEADWLIHVGAAVFIAPMFFFSGLGGQLADRFDKALVARRLKLFEIGVAGLAVAGFLMQSIPLLFFVLFLFGTIAALFGPVKYGILPDHLARRELATGNALVEGATFLAILLGTITAPIAASEGSHPVVFAVMIMIFAGLCWTCSRLIPATGAGAPGLSVDRNILRSALALVNDLRADRRIWIGRLITSWFWVLGLVVLTLLSVLVKDVLGGSEAATSAFTLIFAVGVAAGSGLAAWLVHGRIAILPTPIGGVFMGLFMLDLGCAVFGHHAGVTGRDLATLAGDPLARRVAVDFFGMAVAGGVFIVPIFAAVQAWSDPARRARVIGGLNVLSAGLMVVGALVVALLQSFGLDSATMFILIGAVSILAAAFIFHILPTNRSREFVLLLFRLLCRLTVTGTENIAKAGPGAIIALNHVSFVDAALVFALLDRDVVFAIDRGMAEKWWVKPFLRIVRSIPIDPSKPLATRTLINAAAAGTTLAIFPEGRITVTGSMMKIYDGAGMIADKSGRMLVPVRIDGLEQTFFSRLTGRQVRRRFRPKVRVTVLEPQRISVASELRGKRRRQAAGAALYDIMSDLIFRTTPTDRTIIEAVIAAGHRHGFGRIAVEDPLSGALSYRKLLIGASVLGRKLMPLAPHGSVLGLMLPNANGAAATLLALMSAGRVPAMINFTAGPANILAACQAAKVKTIVTSRAFVEKAKLGALVENLGAAIGIVYLEDIRETVTLADRLQGLLQAKSTLVRREADDPAVVLFTSGSEGTPKGVVLSHRNILVNAAQASARLDFGRTDIAFNALPAFHSFGLTVGLVLPLVFGVRSYLYPSPLHYRIIPELVYASNATLFFGTDTFLAGYARAGHAYDFRSIRYILAGAEPVRETTRQTYLEKFGLRILEGYGVTETAPALALNTPMFNRTHTVGRLLPGIQWKLEQVPGIAQGGRLHVRGGNVMLGYLKSDRPGEIQPTADGWHDTGDIVEIDADGFLAIKGRAKRFAKVGGEMVSLAAVEAVAAEVWPDVVSAVTAVPDPRKGEALVMLTTRKGATRSDFQAHARARGIAELMLPAEVVVVEKMPLLGSGKTDNVGVADLVRQLRGASAVAAAAPV